MKNATEPETAVASNTATTHAVPSLIPRRQASPWTSAVSSGAPAKTPASCTRAARSGRASSQATGWRSVRAIEAAAASQATDNAVKMDIPFDVPTFRSENAPKK